MIVLDAYALVAYLHGEPAADEVAELLRTEAAISAANTAEVIDQMVRVVRAEGGKVHALPDSRGGRP